MIFRRVVRSQKVFSKLVVHIPHDGVDAIRPFLVPADVVVLDQDFRPMDDVAVGRVLLMTPDPRKVGLIESRLEFFPAIFRLAKLQVVHSAAFSSAVRPSANALTALVILPSFDGWAIDVWVLQPRISAQRKVRAGLVVMGRCSIVKFSSHFMQHGANERWITRAAISVFLNSTERRTLALSFVDRLLRSILEQSLCRVHGRCAPGRHSRKLQ